MQQVLLSNSFFFNPTLATLPLLAKSKALYSTNTPHSCQHATRRPITYNSSALDHIHLPKRSSCSTAVQNVADFTTFLVADLEMTSFLATEK